MISILKNGTCDVIIKGHAGYAEHGKDIVCAGVTALTECLISSIADLTTNTPTYEMRMGYVHLKVSSPTEKSKLLFDSFFVGIQNVADEFPEYVQVTEL